MINRFQQFTTLVLITLIIFGCSMLMKNFFNQLSHHHHDACHSTESACLNNNVLAKIALPLNNKQIFVVVVASLLLFTAVYKKLSNTLSREYKRYYKVICDRHGGFISLNKFTDLFSLGLLNPNTF